MDRTRIAGFALAITIIGVALASPTDAQVDYQCTDATPKGAYSVQITGQILTPASAAGSVSGIALTTFDGFGNLTQIDHVVHNGVVPVEEWRPAIGSYKVNSDCTGTLTFTPHPADPADSGPPLKVNFVLTRGGAQIVEVVSGSPSAPAFTANIVATGFRLTGQLPPYGSVNQ